MQCLLVSAAALGRLAVPGLRAFPTRRCADLLRAWRGNRRLIERVGESRFVAVVGASGSGKSSLVGAGLIPRLAANAH